MFTFIQLFEKGKLTLEIFQSSIFSVLKEVFCSSLQTFQQKILGAETASLLFPALRNVFSYTKENYRYNKAKPFYGFDLTS